MSLPASTEGHTLFSTCGSLRLRMPLPEGVVTLGFPRDVAANLRSVLSKSMRVHDAANVHRCMRLLQHHLGLCIIFPVPGVDEDDLGNGLIRLFEQFPNVSCVALFGEKHSASLWAMRLGRAGVTELVAMASSGFPERALLQALSRCEKDSVSTRLWNRANLDVPDSILPVLKPAIRLAHKPVSLASLAGAAQMHERTLRKYCEGRVLPAPQWIIGWARLLVAAYYLEEPGRTAQSTAELLQFPSAVALANHIRRYTSLPPSTLRAQGAVQTVARLFEIVVRESARARDGTRDVHERRGA